MRLHSSTPFWLIKNGLPVSYSPLREDLICDVLILGGGVCGSIVAHNLIKAGVKDVVILDKRDAGWGSTSASTALVMYEVDMHLSDLIKLRGESRAVRSYELCFDATSKIEKIVKNELTIDCSFKRKNTLYLANNQEEARSLEIECKTRNSHGFKVDYLDRPEIEKNFSFSRAAALFSPDKDDAEVDPYALTYALQAANISNQSSSTKNRALRVFTNTSAEKISRIRDRINVTTDRGFRVRANYLVYATGYESIRFLPRKLRNIVKLKSTYALVTDPLPGLVGWGLDECLIWEAERPYFYLRTTNDRRLMIGGGDEDFSNPRKRDELLSQKARLLLSKSKKMFPNLDVEIAHCWAGTFGETKDSLPYIGSVAPVNSPSTEFFALCYGANGINFALIASEIIRDLILGRKNNDAEVFGFQR